MEEAIRIFNPLQREAAVKGLVGSESQKEQIVIDMGNIFMFVLLSVSVVTGGDNTTVNIQFAVVVGYLAMVEVLTKSPAG